MKNILLTIMFVLPLATWQTYSNGILTVYTGADAHSNVYYHGVPKGYDGGAAQPAHGLWTAPWLPTGGPIATTTPSK